MPDPLGPRNVAVRRLRELLRDAKTRAAERAFVVEGPRAVGAALDRGVALEGIFLGPDADRAFAPLVTRAAAVGVPIDVLKPGVLERVGSTVTPQPVLAVASMPRADVEVLRGDGIVLVAVEIADPGNLGTLIRSAEAAAAAAIVLGPGSVDAYNPKVVRASAGAIFGIPVLRGENMEGQSSEGQTSEGQVTEGWSVMDVLGALRDAGRRCYGTRAADGVAPDHIDFTAPVAVLLGNEARGLGDGPGLGGRAFDGSALDGWISIPMAGRAESLNVAMAGTVVCFEAARQRSAAAAGGDGRVS